MHVRAGFRAIARQPALVLGEIACRWAFGVGAWVLVILAFRRTLANVDISHAELLMARRSDLFAVADAWARVVIQVLPELARDCEALAPAIAILWIVAATVGRAVTLRALLHEVTERAPKLRVGALVFVQALRAVFALAAIGAFAGTMLLAGLAMPSLTVTAAALGWILLAALVGLFWSVVNWFLALAPIWIVRDGRPALKSIGESVNLFHRDPGAYVAIGWWFGLLRAIAIVGALLTALIAAAAAGDSNAAAIVACVAVTLIYFAIADWLYMARLAAFVALDDSSRVAEFAALPAQPQSTAGPEL